LSEYCDCRKTVKSPKESCAWDLLPHKLDAYTQVAFEPSMILVGQKLAHFTLSETLTLGLSSFFFCAGTLTQGILIVCWWKLRSKDADEFAIFIIFTNFVGSLVFAALSIIVLSGNGYIGSGLGVTGCVVAGVLLFVYFMTCFCVICIYTLQRYVVVCLEKSLSIARCICFVIFFMMLCSGLCLMCIFSPHGEFSLAPSLIYSMIDWAGRGDTNIIAGYFLLLFASTGFCVIGWTYFSIFRRLGKSLRMWMNQLNSSMNRSISSKNHEVVDQKFAAQRRFVMRSLMILGVYVVVWTPYILQVAFEVATKTSVTPLYNSVSTVFLTTNASLNFLIFLKTNSAYGKVLQEMFGRVRVAT
jgi:hypothetical protein